METKFKGTDAEWSVPHICTDKTSCNCSFVLVDGRMGSLCKIDYSLPGDTWMDGDSPPLQEAKYNGLLISKSLKMLKMLERIASGDINQEEIESLIIECTELP